MDTDRRLKRPYLEAVYVGHCVIDAALLDAVETDRLSPAANWILDRIAEYPALAREDLVTLAGSVDVTNPLADRTYAIRLAERASRLTLVELAFFSRATLVALVNKLPAVSRRRKDAA